MRTRITFGPYAPDNAQHASDALTVADGVYPTANGYAPVKGFHEIADALPGNFKGGASFVSSGGTARMIAADISDVYSLGAGTWHSKLGGMVVNKRWHFTQFGDDVICANGNVPINFNLATNTAAPLAGSPPTADLCATVRDFVVLGRVNGDNTLIGWSGFGSDVDWVVGINQSGLQPMYSGGKVMGLVGGEYGLIIQRFRVVRMSYTGDGTDPWQFDEISTNYGCLAEGSVAQAGRMTFFYSDRGFVVCDGNDVKGIGAERIDGTFKARYSNLDLENMWATVDPVRTLVIWAMPNALWIYNWTLDRWATVEAPVSSAFNSFSEAISIDALDALFGNLDAIPYPLDDPRFAGGTPRLTIVHFDGRFGVLTGPNLAATLTTPYMEFADDRVSRVRTIRPIIDAISGLSLTIDARKRLGDPENLSTFTDLRTSGDMPVRVSARSMKTTLNVAKATDWTFVQALEVELDVGGRR